MRILVVEDEIRLAETLGELLRREGYTADLRHDGESGLDCAMSGIYDMMILDVMLPKLDGFTLLQKLREEGSALPVLLLTGHASLGVAVQGMDLGAYDYMLKPVAINELIIKMEEAVRAAA